MGVITTTPSAFGKVPFRGDFVRLGERAPELLELDAWFQEGIHRAQQAAGGRWNEVFDALPTLAFVYTSRETGVRYTGVLRASRDRTGRRYPITVGCRVGLRDASLGEVPVVLEPFLSAAKLLVEDLRDTSSEHFEIRIEALCQDIDQSLGARDLRQSLAAAKGGSLWSAEDAADRRCVMLAELRSLTVNPAKLALHLPVSGEAHQIAFWLGLVDGWLPKATPMTLAVWVPGVPGSLRLLYDRLIARYFEPMLWVGGDSDYEYDLMHKGAQRDAAVERARASFGGFDLGESTLFDLQQQLAEVSDR